MNLSTFTSHSHAMPTTTVRVGTSSQVYTAFAACPFPPPPSDSPYFQAPSFLMLPTATASNCFFHLHSRFPTRHCLQSPRRFKKCKSDYAAVCLKLLMTFPLFCSQIPPQGPYLARLRTSRGKGLELRSHLTLSKPGRCLLYFLVFVHRCVY